MPSIRPFTFAAIVVASGCTLGSTPQPAYPQQMAWTGPPGGAIDPGYGYDGQGEPNGSYEGSYPPGPDDPSGQATPSADPQDPNYALGDVTDPEIDATLEGYGQWQEDEDYGRVWVPDATVVGAEFTPYDSSGEWAYTDYGWSFQSDWDWGWLPFHYGRWAQYEGGGWCWAPDHTWGSSWVDWRHGNNVIGWNPLAPTIRDHRTHATATWEPGGGDRIRDHRTHKDPNTTWHFAATTEFGWRNRPHAFALGDGMRVTESVTRPPAGAYSGRAASLMGARLRGKAWTSTHPQVGVRPSGTRPNVSTGFTGGRPFSPYLGQSTAGGRPWMKPPSPWGTAQPGAGQRGSAPDYGTYRAPRQGFGQTPPTWGGGRGYTPPPASTGWNTSGADRAPSRPSWNGGNPPPRQSWNPPSNPPSRPSWNGGTPPPRQSWNPPSNPPSRPSWNPPSQPSGGWNTSGSFRAPQRPSFSSGSSGSSSGGSRSWGGSSSGGGSRSYSSGSSGGSRSSGGGSSGGSRSSGGSSSGGGSRSSGGGGRRR